MYKMNYDRLVEALWDEDLKEKIHEAYYSIVPKMRELLRTHPAHLSKAVERWRSSFKEEQSVIYILAIYVLEIEDPDPCELREFILKYNLLIMDRLERILDREEIKEQIKRRGLLR